MRFYAFDFSEIDILPSQSLEDTSGQTQKGHIDGFLASDFTRKSRPAGQQSASFNGEVLSQVLLEIYMELRVRPLMGVCRLIWRSFLPRWWAVKQK